MDGTYSTVCFDDLRLVDEDEECNDAVLSCDIDQPYVPPSSRDSSDIENEDQIVQITSVSAPTTSEKSKRRKKKTLPLKATQ